MPVHQPSTPSKLPIVSKGPNSKTWPELSNSGIFRVTEIFTSVQGEVTATGAGTGMPTTFIRLFGCNLSCAFCDSKMTETPNEPMKMHQGTWQSVPTNTCWEYTKDELVSLLLGTGSHFVTLTGGEPLIYANLIYQLIHSAIDRSSDPLTFEIETNGLLDPLANNSAVKAGMLHWNWSPKLQFNTAVEDFKLLTGKTGLLSLPGRWRRNQKVCLKFVVSTDAEVERAVAFWNSIPDKATFGSIRPYLMPKADNVKDLITNGKLCAEWVLKLKDEWAVSNRLQVLLWNNEAGT